MTYLYYNIKATATGSNYIVCPKPCVLHAITVNQTADGVITIYDGTNEVGILKAEVAEKTYLYDICIKKYLKVVNENDSNITVSYLPAESNITI